MNFLTPELTKTIAQEYGTPVYVYDQATLEATAKAVISFPSAYGLTGRYAMKALPNAAIIRIVVEAGLHVDASSGFEAERAMRARVAPEKIQITAQQLPDNLKDLIDKGINFNACSIHQLRAFGELVPGGTLSIRVNPGMGSGHSNRTNVGGPGASFGIWHELLDEVETVRAEHDLTINAMHTHIGSGSDPEVWQRCARMSLGIAAKLPDVQTLSLGGGFKVGRMADEVSTDLQEVGDAMLQDVRDFTKEHGRELHLEIEPGTYLVANVGAIVASVVDVVSTGNEGYNFIKVDTGMTELLRPSMYGAQHPLTIVQSDDSERGTNDYVVAGHCCESGDILTPAPNDPETLAPRTLIEARIGDLLVIGGAGAYCAGMPAKNYNSFPEAAEVLIASDGTTKLIRKRQTLDQIIANELG